MDTRGSKVYDAEQNNEEEVMPGSSEGVGAPVGRPVSSGESGERVGQTDTTKNQGDVDRFDILQQMLTQMNASLNAKIDSQKADMKTEMASLNQRLDNQDTNFANMRADMGNINAKMDNQNAKMADITQKLDDQNTKFESIGERFDRQDAKFEEVKNDIRAVNYKFVNIEARLKEQEEKLDADIREMEKKVGEINLRADEQQEAVAVINDRVCQLEESTDKRLEELQTEIMRVESIAKRPQPSTSAMVTQLVEGNDKQTPTSNDSVNAGERVGQNVNPFQGNMSPLYHHPNSMWTEQLPKFEGKTYENPMSFLIKLEEYGNFYGMSETVLIRMLDRTFSGTAYYWWQVEKNRVQSYSELKERFVERFWNAQVQGNVRAQLHAERYIPGKGKGIEAHLADIYEKSRYMEPPVTDEEYIAMVLNQLPYRYQTFLTGCHRTDLNSFRESLINFDRIERAQRQFHNSRENEQRQNHGQNSNVLHQNFQQRANRGPDRGYQERRVNYVARDKNRYPEEHNSLNKGRTDGKRTWMRKKPYHRQKHRQSHYNRRAYSDDDEARYSSSQQETRERKKGGSQSNSRSTSPRPYREERKWQHEKEQSPRHQRFDKSSGAEQREGQGQNNPSNLPWRAGLTISNSSAPLDARANTFMMTQQPGPSWMAATPDCAQLN